MTKKKKLLWKSFKGNKKMLESFGISGKEFNEEIMNTVYDALNSKYASSSDKNFDIKNQR